MNLAERIKQADQRRLPDNVVPMDRRPERRAQPRWLERMEQQGLPAKDMTRTVAA